MVYWGCRTPRNKCMWALFIVSGAAGGLLLFAGAAKVDICTKAPVRLPFSGSQCQQGPLAMLILGGCLLMGTIPSLLFFSGCARGPPQPKFSAEGVPCSGITVVKHTSAGQQVFQYDADGKLIAAPDCHKHSKHGPHKYVLSPVKAVPVKAAPALQDENACSRSSSLAVGSLSGAMQQQPEQLVSFSGNAGQSLFKSLSVRILQGALQQDPARPAVSLVGKARQSQQSNYPAIPNWSDSSKETNAVTTDVYISRVEPPRLPTAGPLKAGLAAQKQQQQQQCMQQQQQQHPQPGWEHTPIKQANKPQEQWQQQLQALTQIQQS